MNKWLYIFSDSLGNWRISYVLSLLILILINTNTNTETHEYDPTKITTSTYMYILETGNTLKCTCSKWVISKWLYGHRYNKLPSPKGKDIVKIPKYLLEKLFLFTYLQHTRQYTYLILIGQRPNYICVHNCSLHWTYINSWIIKIWLMSDSAIIVVRECCIIVMIIPATISKNPQKCAI